MGPLEISWYKWPDAPFPLDRRRGGNANGILVAVTSEDLASHSSLLKRILRAIGSDIDTDISLLEMDENENLPVLNSPEIKQYRQVIAFGVTTKQLGMAQPVEANPVKFEQLTVILGPTLGTIASDETAKRRLWGHLKEVFQ